MSLRRARTPRSQVIAIDTEWEYPHLHPTDGNTYPPIDLSTTAMYVVPTTPPMTPVLGTNQPLRRSNYAVSISFFDSANPVPKYDWTGNTHLKKIAFGVLTLIPLVMFIAGFMVLTGITGFIGFLFGLVTYFACSIGIWYVLRELFLEHLTTSTLGYQMHPERRSN